MDNNDTAIQGPVFCENRLIGSVPDDTQVVLWGEAHENIFHRQALYLNLPDFAKAGYQFIFENMQCAQNGMQTMIKKMGYRPYHLQRYEHVVFPNDRGVYPADDATPYDANYNHFRNIHNGATEFKLLKATSRLGMNPTYVDLSLNDMAYSLSPDGMNERNNHMVDAIEAMVADGKKVLLNCGWLHVLGTTSQKLRGCRYSLQELLVKKNIKAFSVANLCEPQDVLVEDAPPGEDGDAAPGNFIKAADATAAMLLDDLYVENDWETCEQAFMINLNEISAQAGRKLPNMLCAFPTATFDALIAHKSRTMYVINPVFEDEMWKNIWSTHGCKAHALYKQQRNDLKL